MQQLKPGSKLNNKYRILRFIGKGGFAFAYEAVQEPIGLKVCIKELFIKESRDTFLREGRILATLKSDSIVKVLDYFEEKGVGVINASPFAMGLLSQRGVPEWHPAPAALVEACRKASDYCLSQGYPIEKLAIQYSVSNPRIGTTLFSSANPDNVLKNIQYIEEPIDWDLVAKVKEIIGDQQRVTWKNT